MEGGDLVVIGPTPKWFKSWMSEIQIPQWKAIKNNFMPQMQCPLV